MEKKLSEYEQQKVDAYKQGQQDQSVEDATGKRTTSHIEGGGVIFDNKVNDSYTRGRNSEK